MPRTHLPSPPAVRGEMPKAEGGPKALPLRRITHSTAAETKAPYSKSSISRLSMKSRKADIFSNSSGLTGSGLSSSSPVTNP